MARTKYGFLKFQRSLTKASNPNTSSTPKVLSHPYPFGTKCLYKFEYSNDGLKELWLPIVIIRNLNSKEDIDEGDISLFYYKIYDDVDDPDFPSDYELDLIGIGAIRYPEEISVILDKTNHKLRE